MKEHPKLLGASFLRVYIASLLDFFTLFILECLPYIFSALNISTAVSSPYISDYERDTYYHGVAPGGNHPKLFYRSDLITNPFPMPKGRHTTLPTKSARPIHNTPLNGCWDTVAPKIVSLLKNQSIRYSVIDPARFFTYGPPGEEEEQGTLGPVTIWIALHPGTTTIEAAHDASLGILELLKANGVDDAVVEWREGAPEKLSGPALLHVVAPTNPTYHVRRFLTAALGMSIAPETGAKNDTQGSVAFFFHENKDRHGNPVDTVLGVSNCHVLSEDVTVDYEFKGSGARAKYVRINGVRRFHWGIQEIEECLSSHSDAADDLALNIMELEAKPKSNSPEEAEDDAKALEKARVQFAQKKEDIDSLDKLRKHAKNQWGNINSRNIGHVHWAPKISVDHGYTKDIGTFVADPKKFKTHFKGNVVDLGTKYTREELTDLFYPQAGGRTALKFPSRGQLQINGCVPRELLANPDCYDGNNQPCLVVMKDGGTTDLTMGLCVGLESYHSNDLGVESMEVAIYNYPKRSDSFAGPGDSGSLVFDGLGRMVGILHTGMTGYITYATPAWWVIEELKKKYPYADFNRTSF